MRTVPISFEVIVTKVPNNQDIHSLYCCRNSTVEGDILKKFESFPITYNPVRECLISDPYTHGILRFQIT